MSKLGGFKTPIIHGLCSLGFTARAIYEKYCNGDPNKISKFGVRFTSHFFPGETYIIDSWKEGKTIIFETMVKERGKVIIKGFAELKDEAKM